MATAGDSAETSAGSFDTLDGSAESGGPGTASKDDSLLTALDKPPHPPSAATATATVHRAAEPRRRPVRIRGKTTSPSSSNAAALGAMPGCLRIRSFIAESRPSFDRIRGRRGERAHRHVVSARLLAYRDRAP